MSERVKLPTSCPSCTSPDFEELRVTAAGAVFDCQDCGSVFGSGLLELEETA